MLLSRIDWYYTCYWLALALTSCQIHPREQAKLDYDAALIERHKHLPEIKRIDRHRQLPKPVFKAQKTREEMKRAAKRREENRRKHSKRAAEAPHMPERKRHLIERED